jgi:resuscitation-promoting factor RpfA
MRTHPRPAPLAVLRLIAATLAVLFTIGAGPADAHVHQKGAPPTDENFARLRACESGGDYQAQARNRYFGAYQFSGPTWRSLGYTGLAHEAAPEVQDEAARRLQDKAGWGQWPGCSRKLGLR